MLPSIARPLKKVGILSSFNETVENIRISRQHDVVANMNAFAMIPVLKNNGA
jgi:hypothetical protein